MLRSDFRATLISVPYLEQLSQALITIFLGIRCYTEAMEPTPPKTLIQLKEERSSEIEDQVSAFLANGGSVTSYDECSIDESISKYRKPYKRVKKDGTVYFVRNSEHHVYVPSLVLGG